MVSNKKIEPNCKNIPKQWMESIEKVKSVQISNYLITHTNQTPSSRNKWIDNYPFSEMADWRAIYTLVPKLSKHSLSVSFQCKVLYKIFNCNHKLYVWGIRSYPACCSYSCSRCGLIDNLEHFFYYCHEVQQFWCKIKDWMTSISIIVKFAVLEVLLEYVHYDESLFHCVNYIVFMGQHFINESRDGKNIFCLSLLLLFLKSKLQTEQEIFSSKERQSVFNHVYMYILSKLE